MDPNGSVPPPPPQSPLGETFVAPSPKSPKKKAHPFLIVFLIVFILFDIGIGALIFIKNNKKQSTSLLKTQETGTNTAAGDQNANINVKQEGVTSLTAPTFQNKLIFQSDYRGTKTLVTTDSDGKNPTDLAVNVNQGNIDGFYVKGSQTSRYLLLYDAQISSGLKQGEPLLYYLYSVYDNKTMLIDTNTIKSAMDKQQSFPQFLGWSNDDKEILFYGYSINQTGSKTERFRHFIASYNIATKIAKTLVQKDLNKYYSVNLNFYDDADQIIIYTFYDENTADRSVVNIPYTQYLRDFKTGMERETQPAKYTNYNHALYSPSYGIYYANKPSEHNESQTFEIFSIKDTTKPIRTVKVNADSKDGVIKSIVWSNDSHYIAVYVQYYNSQTKKYTRNSSLFFYTLEGEEIMHDTIEDLSVFENGNWVEPPRGQFFSANNKNFMLAYLGPGHYTVWKTYDLENKKKLAEFSSQGNAYGYFQYQPLAWY